MKNLLIGLLAGSSMIAIAATASQAAMINATDLTAGLTDVTGLPLGMEAHAAGGVFDQKTLNGVTGTGVSGPNDGVAGEINQGESVTFDTTTPSPLRVTGFTIAFLYHPPAFGDTVDETARVQVTGPNAGNITIVASGVNAGTLNSDFGGILTNLSPADETGAGEWQVTGINNALFTALTFSSTDPSNNPVFGDFSIVNLTYDQVPEPGTLSLLAAGLLGLGFVARRKQRA